MDDVGTSQRADRRRKAKKTVKSGDGEFGVQPTDPLVATIAVGALAAVGVAAAWIPARRAARVDPLIALRTE